MSDTSDQSSASSRPEPASGAASKSASRWLLAVGALLWMVAFRALLSSNSSQSASRELEDWFFATSDTAPLIVVAMSLWLLYRRWERLTGLPDREAAAGDKSSSLADRSGWLAGGLLALGAGVLSWATLTAAIDLVAVALLFVGAGLAILWKGSRALQVVWLPGLMLLFAVPIPPALSSVVIYDFQLWSGQWCGALLHWIGSPSFVSGDLIHRPTGTFSIIEGCSGMRSVETLTMLSILLVEVLGRSGVHALTLVVVAPLIAFAMNGLRVLTLIFNPHSEIVAIHNLQGVALLLCGLAGLVLVDWVLDRSRKVFHPRMGAPDKLESGESKAQRLPAVSSFGVPARSAALGVAALSLCLVVTLVIPPFAPRTRVSLGLHDLLAKGIGEWRGSQLKINREFLGGAWFREELHARYRAGDRAVDLFLGLGDRGRRDSTFLSPKTALPGSGWAVLDGGKLAPAAGDWQLLRASARRVLVYHWYLGTEGVAHEALRSLLALDSSPFQSTADGMVIRISTELAGPGLEGLEAAGARLRGFRQALLGELQPLRRAHPVEASSLSSLSRKTFSVLFLFSQRQNIEQTGTYGV